MKTDLEIAQHVNLKNIEAIANQLGMHPDALECYGKYKAKIDVEKLKSNHQGKLVLVSAITPTPPGEGKTTMNIGLSMSLNALGYSSISALREPSMGPSFGLKGGATGGGQSQVLPMEDINLHFTGDFHAITSANNLLSAMLDNHIFQGNALNIDPDSITLKRVLDVNDRALRRIALKHRSSGFEITVASEVMAIFCLAEDMRDLKRRLGNMVIAYTYDKKAITPKDLNAVGSMAVLLKDALKPNLVQTLEHTPAIIHGGPFANIAHGCNSVIATKTAMKLSDYTITEAGFGSDLGAEKFMNIKCVQAGLSPDVIVLVVTLRALKYHGEGYENLTQHIRHLKLYGVPMMVLLNRFPDDDAKDMHDLKMYVESLDIAFEISEAHNLGSKGNLDAAKKIVTLSNQPKNFKPLYTKETPLKEKIECIVKNVYGAKGVTYSPQALLDLEKYDPNLGVCMAKTQYSLSDNPKLLGAPKDFDINISSVHLSSGAGFVVCQSGNILTMPGLPKSPVATSINLEDDGKIVGLF
ncbi:MAG: formate--tetrahydrofolate ligase [Erysipelothrix sp.]|nr:formate--tetrahydrofolate ligase [Erysipelothrix sp.]